jgi:hypothetical protein
MATAAVRSQFLSPVARPAEAGGPDRDPREGGPLNLHDLEEPGHVPQTAGAPTLEVVQLGGLVEPQPVGRDDVEPGCERVEVAIPAALGRGAEAAVMEEDGCRAFTSFEVMGPDPVHLDYVAAGEACVIESRHRGSVSASTDAPGGRRVGGRSTRVDVTGRAALSRRWTLADIIEGIHS